MPYRGTLFFEAGVNGWSETYLLTAGTLNSASADMVALLRNRADLLGDNAAITYLRISQTDPQRDSLLVPVAPATGKNSIAIGDCDPPSTALLLIAANSTVQYKRHFWLRGVPDSQVNSGNLIPAASYLTSFNLFRTQLNSGAYAVGAQTYSLANRQVVSAMRNITGGYGELDVPAAAGILYGDVIVVRGGRFAQGLEGRHRVFGSRTVGFVQTLTIRTPYNLAGYTFGATVEKALVTAYPILTNYFERIGTRKTGRPFGVPAGRRRVVQQA